MKLGVEVGLGPGHIVLDGDPAPPPPKGCTAAPIFGPCLLWQNGWMDQDATWYEDRPHYVRLGPLPPERRGTASNFRPMSIVAKRFPSQLLLSTCKHVFQLHIKNTSFSDNTDYTFTVISDDAV